MTQNATKIQGKFYPLTPELAHKLREAKLTAAEWRFWAYLVEIDPYGDRYHDLNPLTIQTECKISKPTYYRAKAKFQELQIFDFQEEKVSFRNLTGVSKMRLGSQKRDSKSQKRDSKSQKREKPASKPASDKDSSSSQIYKTYSEFKDSLSQEERESFLEFGKKKASELPKPPQLPLKWIEKNWEELFNQWLKASDENKNQNQKTKYNFAAYSEPQHQMWYEQLQVVVNGVIESGDSTRLELWLQDDFYNSWLGWAKTARQDVREFWASHPILEQKNYDS